MHMKNETFDLTEDWGTMSPDKLVGSIIARAFIFGRIMSDNLEAYKSQQARRYAALRKISDMSSS
jgi:hypothetical protein